MLAAPARELKINSCRVWTPPLFVQQGDADSTDFASQPVGTLQACAQARLNSFQEAEEFADSQISDGSPVQKDAMESCSGMLSCPDQPPLSVAGQWKK